MINLEKILQEKLKTPEKLTAEKIQGNTYAAILVPFVFTDNEWHLLFTRRTIGVRSHQGEVSFPGGAYESVDKLLLKNTALRETQEEIGVQPEQINVIGAMDEYRTISRYCVTPFVGIMDWPIPLVLNTEEVESAFHIPISWLSDQKNRFERNYQQKDGPVRPVLHYNDYNGEHVWGFTAHITFKILEMIK
jgi:8-oxo-dGTP pyrophosphatase MutT (NUDIX family)